MIDLTKSPIKYGESIVDPSGKYDNEDESHKFYQKMMEEDRIEREKYNTQGFDETNHSDDNDGLIILNNPDLIKKEKKDFIKKRNHIKNNQNNPMLLTQLEYNDDDEKNSVDMEIINKPIYKTENKNMGITPARTGDVMAPQWIQG